MILINERYKGIRKFNTDEHRAQLFWSYDFIKDGDPKDSKNLDFFLRQCLLWQNITSDAYKIRIGDASVWLPFNYHLLLGDFDSGLDCISPQEILNRPFQAITFSNTLDESTIILKDIKVIGYEEERTFIVPFEKGIFPILAGNDRAVLVSSKDFYNKIKNTTLSGLL
jgi:hypothetical protein